METVKASFVTFSFPTLLAQIINTAALVGLGYLIVLLIKGIRKITRKK